VTRRTLSTADRVASLEWSRIRADLNTYGCAPAGAILTPAECAELIRGYGDQAIFRSRVVMGQHAFGKGEYKYYAYPLPHRIADLRLHFYPPLADIANEWASEVGDTVRYPSEHKKFLERCHAAGQVRPTPLMLKYAEGDYNCLHQDLYGEIAFPLQLTILLSAPQEDFRGGEFVLTEQRPRMQSRVEVVSLGRGDGVVFAVNQRPVQGKHGVYRVAMRHGVSRLRAGRRFALGIIFHDAA